LAWLIWLQHVGSFSHEVQVLAVSLLRSRKSTARRGYHYCIHSRFPQNIGQHTVDLVDCLGWLRLHFTSTQQLESEKYPAWSEYLDLMIGIHLLIAILNPENPLSLRGFLAVTKKNQKNAKNRLTRPGKCV
jgi:hypothetical protein